MYDFKKLSKRLKEKGLVELEDTAEMVFVETMDWLSEEALASESKADDFIASLTPIAKSYVLPAIDKIDGKTNN